jgi:hypothetical protein
MFSYFHFKIFKSVEVEMLDQTVRFEVKLVLISFLKKKINLKN